MVLDILHRRHIKCRRGPKETPIVRVFTHVANNRLGPALTERYPTPINSVAARIMLRMAGYSPSGALPGAPLLRRIKCMTRRRRDGLDRLGTPRESMPDDDHGLPMWMMLSLRATWWCWSGASWCRHQAEADMQTRIDVGMGAVPLTVS